MISSFTAPNNGFSIVKMAPVIYTTNQGQRPVLGINDVTFAAADTFEEFPNASFALTAVNIQLGQQSPIGPFGGGNVANNALGRICPLVMRRCLILMFRIHLEIICECEFFFIFGLLRQ